MTAGATASAVEDAGFALLKFEGSKSHRARRQLVPQPAPAAARHRLPRVRRQRRHRGLPRRRAGAVSRIHANGEAKETVLKLPRLTHYAALMRHLRECLLGKGSPAVGASEGIVLMQMIDAIYKSAATGRSVEVK